MLRGKKRSLCQAKPHAQEMEVKVAWHRRNNTAERDGHGQTSLAYKTPVTEVFQLETQIAVGKIKLEEAQTTGRSTNEGGEPNLLGGDKEEKNKPKKP